MMLLLKLCSWMSNSLTPESPPIPKTTAFGCPRTHGESAEGVLTGQYPPLRAVRRKKKGVRRGFGYHLT